MPTYEYVCAEGHAFEKIQKMSDRPLRKCPTCGARAERKVSGGSGLIFKGSGFYITDYGKDGKGARKEPAADAAPAAEAKSAAASGGSAAPAPAPTTDAPKKSKPKADAA
jgi:putative FmdB family regulatory protein